MREGFLSYTIDTHPYGNASTALLYVLPEIMQSR